MNTFGKNIDNPIVIKYSEKAFLKRMQKKTKQKNPNYCMGVLL